MKSKKNKVFCIGFQKTGTTSMNSALTYLGYSVLSTRMDLVYKAITGNLKPIMNIIEKYDAVEDTPFPILYKELDKEFPDAKFILTVRDSNKWITSLISHFKDGYTTMREFLYGSGYVKGNEENCIKVFEQHNKDVQEYFKDRQDKLLVLEIGDPESWKKIGEFLNEPIPDIPFPFKNRAIDR